MRTIIVKDLSQRQQEILIAARTLGIAIPREIANKIEKPLTPIQLRSAVHRVRSVIDSLKKKNIWPYTNEGYTISNPDFRLIYPEDQARKSWDIEENTRPPIEIHNGIDIPMEKELRKNSVKATYEFAMEVLSMYTELPESSQHDMWETVCSLVCYATSIWQENKN